METSRKGLARNGKVLNARNGIFAGTEIKHLIIIKKTDRLREYDRWGHPVILIVHETGKKGEEICSHRGSNPGLPGVALHQQPLG